MPTKKVEDQGWGFPGKGWGFPGSGRKWHYFIGIASLCGRWWYSGELFPDAPVDEGDCKECVKKLNTLHEV